MDTKPIAMSRGVIEALNEELAYQAVGDDECVAAEDDGVSGQLVALATHARRAQDAWTENASETPALHELRKVAAIAIRALELYGCPQGDEPDKSKKWITPYPGGVLPKDQIEPEERDPEAGILDEPK